MISKLEIDRSSVFLVSGGAKGITAQCVIKLAEYYQCKWILLGRSELLEVEPNWAKDCVAAPELKKRIMQDFLAKGEKPKPIEIERLYKKIASSREIEQTLSTLSQLGSKAEYLSVDVTDAIALQNSVAAAVDRLGAITGIIHGAGNLADKLIDKKTEADFEKVYSAKVTGLENLLSCVNLDRLDYLILFSSVAGFFGNAGQTDYALANEILNKSAHLVQQNHPSCRVIAINWGPWDSGMVTPQLKKAFAERNIEVIPLEVGAQMLVNEIEAVEEASTQVLIGSPISSRAEKSTTPLRNYRIRRQLTLEANPFLHDHTIGDRPVLPLTCAASWIGTTCEQLYPGYKFFSLENFKVLKGIVFDGSQPTEFILDIKEVDKTALGEIVFEVILWSEIKNKKAKFFNAFITAVKLKFSLKISTLLLTKTLLFFQIINI
ncbi:MAG: SDR family NAD(P)-dependent oxidoreductase [Prochloraceae cyanobacterium]|nr:SDR family NAD(P)-dependent oxidoreductase [Prochloraceae cyanobacterium]